MNYYGAYGFRALTCYEHLQWQEADVPGDEVNVGGLKRPASRDPCYRSLI